MKISVHHFLKVDQLIFAGYKQLFRVVEIVENKDQGVLTLQYDQEGKTMTKVIKLNAREKFTVGRDQRKCDETFPLLE